MKQAEIHATCAMTDYPTCKTNATWEIGDSGDLYAAVYACTEHRDAVKLWYRRVTHVRDVTAVEFRK